MQLAWVLDCRDPQRLAPFWAAALGYRAGAFVPPYLRLTDPVGRRPDLLLQQVPEEKSGKNRMHLDLRVASLDEPLEALLGRGARLLRGPFDDAGRLTAVLADPEGNELCLLVPPPGPERDATRDPGAPGASRPAFAERSRTMAAEDEAASTSRRSRLGRRARWAGAGNSASGVEAQDERDPFE